MPQYLASIDVGRSFESNVVDQFLSPRGIVRTQVESALLQEQGLREYMVTAAFDLDVKRLFFSDD